MARDQLGIQVITPVYFGSRSVNLKPDKKIKTPADMAGIKLRMPPGEFWQFLGESLGANPTPVAYAELYTALQTGTVDGQDNPLVASKLMKFDEVTSQFVLTSHVIGYDVMVIRSKIWDAMKPDAASQVPGRGRQDVERNMAKYDAQEDEAIEYFKKEGKKVYAPDQNAFRSLRAEEVCRQIRQRLAEGRARADQRGQVIALSALDRPSPSTAADSAGQRRA